MSAKYEGTSPFAHLLYENVSTNIPEVPITAKNPHNQV